jgi:hypothetical protein
MRIAVALLWMVGALTVYNFRRRRLPNWLTLSLPLIATRWVEYRVVLDLRRGPGLFRGNCKW